CHSGRFLFPGRGAVVSWKLEYLRNVPLRDLINGLCVGGPYEPLAPRVDVSSWSVGELVNALMGRFVDSAAEELMGRASAERLTVWDLIQADIRRQRQTIVVSSPKS